MGHTTMKKTILALSLAVAAACFGTTDRALADSITVKDAAGRSIAITDPSRIVSVGGAVTEILYALGLESRIIAVDSTSLYPPHALAEKPSVRRARPRSFPGPRCRGLGSQGHDRSAEGRVGALRANPRPVHRRRYRRENPADRAGDRIGPARRMPGQTGGG